MADRFKTQHRRTVTASITEADIVTGGKTIISDSNQRHMDTGIMAGLVKVA